MRHTEIVIGCRAMKKLICDTFQDLILTTLPSSDVVMSVCGLKICSSGFKKIGEAYINSDRLE